MVHSLRPHRNALLHSSFAIRFSKHLLAVDAAVRTIALMVVMVHMVLLRILFLLVGGLLSLLVLLLRHQRVRFGDKLASTAQ